MKKTKTKILTAIATAATVASIAGPAFAVEAFNDTIGGGNGDVIATAVPEPATMTLMGAGIAGIAVARRARRTKGKAKN